MRGSRYGADMASLSTRPSRSTHPALRGTAACLVALAASCAAVETDAPAEPEPRPLFNGTDLTGWHADVPAADGDAEVPPSFEVRDGRLVSRGHPSGHLITDEAFADYRLVVEYRWPGRPGNCGILVHASEPRMLYGMFPKSIECQMHAGNAGDFWCIGEDITVEDMVMRRGPKESWGVVEGKNRRIKNTTDDSERPIGDWNQMVVECRDDRITVWVNGDLVNEGFDCTASSGQIAIQAEGTPCEFRKVELTPLLRSSDATPR